MMKTIKGILVDVQNEEVKVVEIEDELQSYYKILCCDIIDITQRKIGDKHFDIVCDDEGLLKENPKISAIDVLNRPQLVGNLFIVNFNGQDITSLDDEDIKYVKERIHVVRTNYYPNGYPMVTQLGF